jgi:phage terminase large subunit
MKKTKKFKVISPKFLPLYEKHRYKVYYGGRGGAKSWALAQAAVYFMNTYYVRILSCRMHMNSIRESNHKLVSDTIERMGLSSQFEIGQYEIKNKNTGSTMFFKGLAGNFASLKSIENVGICIVDEAESITEEAWDFLIPTIRAKGSEIWVSFNPRFISDNTWQRFIVNTPKNAVVVKVDITDNPKASDELIMEMEHDREHSPDRYKWIWCGEPLGNSEMTLITQTMINDAKRRIPVRNDNLAIIAGFDVSGLGSDWTVIVRRRGDEILSTHKMQRGDTIQVTDWAKDIYHSHQWDKLIVDASGSTGVYDNMNQWARSTNQYECFKFLGGAAPSRKELYTNKRTETWVKMRDWLSSTGSLSNDTEWDDMVQIKYTFAEREQIKLLSKKDIKKSPDFGDALSMTFHVTNNKRPIENQTHRTTPWHG